MPCTCPIDAWPPDPAVGGPIVFTSRKSYQGAKAFQIPCGHCIGCRIDYMTDWSTRMVCESYMHQTSYFITTTYSDKHLPDNYSLNKTHHQLFIKRLREHFYPTPARFVCAGEYGTNTLRPHYHYILFGITFADLKIYRRSTKGNYLYTSQTLHDLWGMGNCTIGTFTPSSASYAAGYIVKRFHASDQEAKQAWYTRIHPLTGEQVQVIPEFLLSSRRPGIGMPWFLKYGEHIPYDDFIVIEGKRRRVPRYFFNKLTEDQQAKLKQTRLANAALHAADMVDARLITKHELGILNDADYIRKLED